MRELETVFLLGAGASVDAGLPAATILTERYLNHLRTEGTPFGTAPLANNLYRLLGGPAQPVPIEDLVEAARLVGGSEQPYDRLSTLLQPAVLEHRHAVGILLLDLTAWIVKDLSTHVTPERRAYLAGLERFSRRGALDIFTLNYDLLLEAALRDQAVPFTTGFGQPGGAPFQSSNQPRRLWNPQCFEAPVIRLHKLHGSLSWFRLATALLRGSPGPTICYEADFAAVDPINDPPLLVFGVREKYTPYAPFNVLWHRFEQTLLRADVLVAIGYGFGDSLVNRLIHEAQQQRWLLGPPLIVVSVGTSDPFVEIPEWWGGSKRREEKPAWAGDTVPEREAVEFSGNPIVARARDALESGSLDRMIDWFSAAQWTSGIRAIDELAAAERTSDDLPDVPGYFKSPGGSGPIQAIYGRRLPDGTTERMFVATALHATEAEAAAALLQDPSLADSQVARADLGDLPSYGGWSPDGSYYALGFALGRMSVHIGADLPWEDPWSPLRVQRTRDFAAALIAAMAERQRAR